MSDQTITTPAEFKSFTRDECLLIPTWFHYKKGDFRYDNEKFVICIRPCLYLGVLMKDAKGQPDFGESLSEQGGTPDPDQESEKFWGACPSWFDTIGFPYDPGRLLIQKFSDFVKQNLSAENEEGLSP